MRDVFISYSHKDEQWVNEVLVPGLRAHGVDVLIDAEYFQPGPAAIQNMTDAVAGCQRTLVVLTPHWVASDSIDRPLVQGDPRPSSRRAPTDRS